MKLNSTSKKKTCIGSGYITLDIILSEIGDKFPNFLTGGSCGNVLTILSYMGWNSYPIARLGNDIEGKRIIQDMKKWNVKTKFIDLEINSKTPRIIEKIIEGKVPKHVFTMKCKHGNWLPNRKPFLLKSFRQIQYKIPKSNIFYFDRATPCAYEIALHAKEQNSLIMFEPPKFINNDKTFLKCLKISDIVKHCYTDKEKSKFCDIDIPLEIQTNGAQGLRYKAKFLDKQSWKNLDAKPVDNLVDAAGSGDWLTAGLIHLLHNRKSFNHLSVEKLEYMLNFSQILASLNCNFLGARGMMYYLSKDDLFKIALKKIKHKNNHTITFEHIKKNIPLSKLASKCKICMCNTT